LGSIAFRTVLANPSGAAIARILSAGCNNPAAVLRDGGNADEQDKAGARRRMGHGIEPREGTVAARTPAGLGDYAEKSKNLRPFRGLRKVILALAKRVLLLHFCCSAFLLWQGHPCSLAHADFPSHP
jgi:hypothetical protein